MEAHHLLISTTRLADRRCLRRLCVGLCGTCRRRCELFEGGIGSRDHALLRLRATCGQLMLYSMRDLITISMFFHRST